MNNPQLKIATLNGAKIAFSSQTEFKVQVSSPKGPYKTRYSFVGNLGQAVLFFNGINLGYGWKKRLIAPSFNKPVFSQSGGIVQ